MQNFSHLARCTPAQWAEVCSIINAPRFAEGWARAFARARASTTSPTTATNPPRPSGSAAQAASAASWRVAFDRAAGHVAPTAKPTPAVLSWDRAFEKAGAVRRK